MSEAQTILNYVLPTKEITALEEEALKFLKENKEKGEEKTLRDFVMMKLVEENSLIQGDVLFKYDVLHGELALKKASEAKLIKQRIQEITAQREREKGKDIFLDKEGKAFAGYE